MTRSRKPDGGLTHRPFQTDMSVHRHPAPQLFGELPPSIVSQGKRRILFVSHTCYFDTNNGASIASRSLMECLSRQGFTVAAMSGTVLESSQELDAGDWLAEQGATVEHGLVQFSSSTAKVPVRAQRHVIVCSHKACGSCCTRVQRQRLMSPTMPSAVSFLGCYRALVEFRPDVVVSFGGDALAAGVRHSARAKGAAVVFVLHNLSYRSREPFQEVDAVIVASRFAAAYYRKTLGIECKTIPNLIDFDRVRPVAPDPRYVTFVNPTYEKGVYPFARIAEELGRRVPTSPCWSSKAGGRNDRWLTAAST